MSSRRDSRERWLAAALIAAALIPILLLTLISSGGAAGGAGGAALPGVPSWCIACGDRGAADFILNLALFVPLGAALRRAGLRAGAAAVIGLALSAGIEAAQLWMPDRHTALGDLIANGLGATAGAALAGTGPLSLRTPPSFTRQIALTALVSAIWIGTALAFRPSLPEREYYGQWTAELGSYASYDGRVLEAAIGDQSAPSWRLRSSASARQALLTGDTLTVTALAGPPPEGLAPIFSIYDDQQQEMLLLGADGDDLVLRVRRRASDLRFEAPELRWSAALAAAAPGDTVHLAAWRAAWGRRSFATEFCIRAEADVRCGGPTIGRGWILLFGPGTLPAAVEPMIDAIWLMSLVAMALWWAPSLRTRLSGLAFLVLIAGTAMKLGI